MKANSLEINEIGKNKLETKTDWKTGLIEKYIKKRKEITINDSKN